MKTLYVVCGGLLFICVCYFVPEINAGAVFPFKSCTSDSDCSVQYTSCRHLDCVGLVCRCFNNMTMDEGGESCKIPRKRGESCDDDATTRCVYKGVFCCNGTCQCEAGLVPGTEYDCVAQSTVGLTSRIASGQTCSSTDSCSIMDEDCVSGTCGCGTGFRQATEVEIRAYANLDSRCRPTNYSLDSWNRDLCGFIPLDVGAECGVDEMYDCRENAVCAWKNCTTKVCVCKANYVPRWNATKCLPDRHLNELCTEEEQCVDFETHCNGRCACNDGFVDNGRGECWFNNNIFANYNESCDEWDKSVRTPLTCTFSTVCDETTEVCTCRKNYAIVKEIHRRWRSYHNFIKCVIDDKFWLTDQEYDEQCASTTTIPTTTEEVIKVGRNCSQDNICPNGSSCVEYGCSKKCACDVGMVARPDRESCVAAAAMNETCGSADNCAFSNGECTNSRCQCESGYMLTADKRQCKNVATGAPTGGDCTVDNDCFLGMAFLNHQTCVSNVCECTSTKYREMSALELRTLIPDLMTFKCEDKNIPKPEDPCGGTTPTTSTATTTTPTTTTTTTPTTTTPTTTVTPHLVKIDEVCDNTIRLCPTDSSCTATYDGSTKCQCDLCYYYNHDKTGCLRLRFYGEPCDANTKCAGSGSHCSVDSNTCVCNVDHVPNMYYCLPTYNFVTTIQMKGIYNGTDGSTTLTECDGSSNFCERDMDCPSGRCVCQNGYREADGNDRCAAPTFNRNCVPSNWTSGYRPPRGSPEASLLTSEDASVGDILKELKEEEALREQAAKKENSKLIIAACIGAAGVFIILAFVFMFVRTVRRKQRAKNIDDDASTRSDSSRIALFRGFTSWLGKNYNKPVH